MSEFKIITTASPDLAFLRDKPFTIHELAERLCVPANVLCMEKPEVVEQADGSFEITYTFTLEVEP